MRTSVNDTFQRLRGVAVGVFSTTSKQEYVEALDRLFDAFHQQEHAKDVLASRVQQLESIMEQQKGATSSLTEEKSKLKQKAESATSLAHSVMVKCGVNNSTKFVQLLESFEVIGDFHVAALKSTLRNVLVVGRTGAGKTTLMHCLRATFGAAERMRAADSPDPDTKGVEASSAIVLSADGTSLAMNYLDTQGFGDGDSDPRYLHRLILERLKDQYAYVNLVLLVISAHTGYRVDAQILDSIRYVSRIFGNKFIFVFTKTARFDHQPFLNAVGKHDPELRNTVSRIPSVCLDLMENNSQRASTLSEIYKHIFQAEDRIKMSTVGTTVMFGESVARQSVGIFTDLWSIGSQYSQFILIILVVVMILLRIK